MISACLAAVLHKNCISGAAWQCPASASWAHT